MIQAGVKITQHLRGFHVLRRFLNHRKISLDGVLETVLIEEFLRALQILVNVGGHLPA